MIGISLLTLVPGVVGGSETYVRALCRELARAGELEYRAFVPTIAPDAAEGLPSRTVRSYPAATSTPGRVRAMALARFAPARIRRELELDRLRAIHFPLSVMLPDVTDVPAAATIHDVQHEFFPQFFPRAEVLYRKAMYARTARRSRIVIAISEHVAGTLRDRLRPADVRVIPLGLDHDRFRPGDEPREPFLLYPANRWPHKNHARLLDAFGLLRRERPELRLVLTGAGHEGPAREGVEIRGRVSLDEVAALMRRASALVFPSLYEGFGLPPLEAMACGCPVAAADIEALRETTGGAARLFDPHSAEAIAAAVDDVLRAPDEWVRRGLERAAGFTWERTAREHDALYRELVDLGPMRPRR